MLTEVKGYLKITWDDEDPYIEGFITRGKDHLEGLTGTKLAFEKSKPKSLLFDYCRYAYNNALEYFDENFRGDILRLQLQEAVNEKVTTDEG